MSNSCVCLTVPAEASFARTVRMAAANLAVLCNMSVDDVEDVRMAAEEGFVYACATAPQQCAVSFELQDDAIAMNFSLGEAGVPEDEELDLVALLLSAVCDEFDVTDAAVLHLLKRGERAHA